MELALITALVTALIVVGVIGLWWIVYFLFTLPLRRRERARLFLDLVETAIVQGLPVEQSLVAISDARERSVGVRFHLVAEHLRQGKRLSEALARVPRFLPPEVNAMIRVGEELGDYSRILPACRRWLRDGISHVRAAENYIVPITVILLPLMLVVCGTVAQVTFPKFHQIAADMEVPLPAFSRLLVHTTQPVVLLLAGLYWPLLLLPVLYVAGPRLSQATRPVSDWMAYRLPWRRKRMKRDFAAMLGVLLDAGVPEDRALELAADSAGNRPFARAIGQARDALKTGRTLPEALAGLDARGELSWRLTNAGRSALGFTAALGGWLESLAARADQQEQAINQGVTTGFVVLFGVVVGAFIIGVFEVLIAITDHAVLW